MTIIELGLASAETKAIDPSLKQFVDGNPPLPPGKVVKGRILNPN